MRPTEGAAATGEGGGVTCCHSRSSLRFWRSSRCFSASQRSATFCCLSTLAFQMGFRLANFSGGQRLLGRLAPDVKILLRRVRRAHLGRAHVPGRDALPAPVGLLLLAASFGPLLVGQIEPGIGGRSRVYGIGPRGLTCISLSLQLGGCGWLQLYHSFLQVRREGALARHFPQPGEFTRSISRPCATKHPRVRPSPTGCGPRGCAPSRCCAWPSARRPSGAFPSACAARRSRSRG